MFIYENIIVSEEVLQARFACELKTCRGICCTDGDAGAPLTGDEAAFFTKNLEELKKFPAEYAERFARHGVIEDLFVKRLKKNIPCTATCENGDCVFSFTKQKIYYCYLQSTQTIFKKPLSCSLFPIREKAAGGMIYLNLFVYEECEGCYGASKPPLVDFLESVLRGRYGDKFYDALRRESDIRHGK